MIGVLRIAAFLSVVVLLGTFIGQRSILSDFFGSDDDESTKGHYVENRKKRKTHLKKSNNEARRVKSENIVISESLEKIKKLEKTLSSYHLSCQNELNSIFKGVDLIDPSSSVFKNWKTVSPYLYQIESLIEKMSVASRSISKEIQELISYSGDRFVWDKILVLINKKMDICKNQNLENFLTTLPESLNERSWPGNSRENIQRFYMKFARMYVDSGQSLQQIYRGLGLLKMGNRHGVFKDFDQEYLDQLYVLIEERKEELAFQFKNVSNPDEKKSLLEEEVQWRNEFRDEVLDFLRL